MEDVGAKQENDGGQNCKSRFCCHFVAKQTRYPEISHGNQLSSVVVGLFCGIRIEGK